MALHLAEISRTVTPGAHAVLLLDQAGWHLSAKLDVPNNITLMPLPPKSPELNPVENIWQFIRDNWLSDRIGPTENACGDIAKRTARTALRIWARGQSAAAGALRPYRFGILASADLEG